LHSINYLLTDSTIYRKIVKTKIIQMKNASLTFALFFLITTAVFSQNRILPSDTAVIITNAVVINGQNVTYQAKTGTQPVWNEQGAPIATLRSEEHTS